MIKKQKADDGTRNPISIVTARVPFNTSKTKEYSPEIEIRLHPTQKPLELLRYLIKTFSNEGEVILDNCMGVGSTCVAAILEDRKYVGFELNETYFKIASDRIQKTENKIES